MLAGGAALHINVHDTNMHHCHGLNGAPWPAGDMTRLKNVSTRIDQLCAVSAELIEGPHGFHVSSMLETLISSETAILRPQQLDPKSKSSGLFNAKA